MNGRNRINKGSNNFKKILSSSKEATKLYNFLNSHSTFIKILKFLKKIFNILIGNFILKI